MAASPCAAPTRHLPGPTGDFRIDIDSDDGRTLRVVMFNVTPEGQEALAVEASYTRSGTSIGPD